MEYVYIESNVSSSGIQVKDSDYCCVYGTAFDATIHSGGSMRISYDGFASGVEVQSAGNFEIQAGGSATDIYISSGGSFSFHRKSAFFSDAVLEKGGIVAGCTFNQDLTLNKNSAGAIVIAPSVEIHGYSSYITRIYPAYLQIGTDGVLSNVTVHSGGEMYVSGGTVNNAVVSSGGSAIVSSGMLESAIVSSGGKIFVENGTVGTLTLKQGGILNDFSFSTDQTYRNAGSSIIVANGVTISASYNSLYGFETGYMAIMSGGSISDVTIHGDYHRSWVRVSSGTIRNAVMKDGTMQVCYEGSAANTVVSNGNLIVQGGTIRNTVVSSGGSLTLNSPYGNGYIYDLDLRAGAALNAISFTKDVYINSMCNDMPAYVAHNVYFLKQVFHVGSGGSISDIDIHYTGRMNVSAGGYASNVKIVTSSAKLNVDGTLDNLTVADGSYTSICVNSGGVINSGIVRAHADVYVSSGGVVSDTVLSASYNDAAIYLSSGAVASGTVLSGYAGNVMLYVSSGAVANDTTVAHGKMHIASGAQVSGVEIAGSGSLNIASGGIVNGLNMSSYGDLYINSGVVVNNANFAEHATLNISSGGVVSNVTLDSYGRLYIENGGVLKGALQNTGSYTTVYVYDGGIINFTVAERTVSDDYLIYDLSQIKGAPTYTITISADQTVGTYKLAQGATAFTDTITICTEDTCFGDLTVNGNGLIYNDRVYGLNLVDGKLTLRVDNMMTDPIYKNGNFDGVFELTVSGTGVIHGTDGKQTVSGTVDLTAWELLDTGDFCGAETNGLLWKERATGHVYVQNDVTSFDEITQKTKCIGTVTDDYQLLFAGDFAGTGKAGVVMQGPAFGDASVSLNYGLPIWGEESDGTMFTGWLGALVNTWQPGQALKGNPADLAEINAKNYMYDVIGIGDFNGDGADDVLLQNTMPETVDGVMVTGSGDVFVFLTGDINSVKAGADPTVAYSGRATGGWSIVGAGDFDGDGVDDLLLTDGSGIAGWKMQAGQRVENQWFGYLGENQKIVGISDLNNDGTDDILLMNTATETFSGLLVKDGAVNGLIALA